jgi:hypothetical protein
MNCRIYLFNLSRNKEVMTYKIIYLRDNKQKNVLWIGNSLINALNDFIFEFNLTEKDIISIEFIED